MWGEGVGEALRVSPKTLNDCAGYHCNVFFCIFISVFKSVEKQIAHQLAINYLD